MTEQEAQAKAVELAKSFWMDWQSLTTEDYELSQGVRNDVDGAAKLITEGLSLPRLLQAEAERDELKKQLKVFPALLAVAVISESLVWLRSVKTEPAATVEALREALSALPKGLLEAERREA